MTRSWLRHPPKYNKIQGKRGRYIYIYKQTWRQLRKKWHGDQRANHNLSCGSCDEKSNTFLAKKNMANGSIVYWSPFPKFRIFCQDFGATMGWFVCENVWFGFVTRYGESWAHYWWVIFVFYLEAGRTAVRCPLIVFITWINHSRQFYFVWRWQLGL